MKYPQLFTLATILTFSLITSCGKEENIPPVVPKILIEDYSVTEGNSGSKTAVITVDLTEATTAEVSFTWSTEDGSATAGEDYEALTDQTVVFAPGDVTRTIQVPILPDNNLELNDFFKIRLSDFQNATSSITSIKVAIENDDSYTCEKAADGYITPATYPNMNLIWSDEFDGTALNTADWNYELGAGGWGNNELETYTANAENSFVKDGFLTIKATKNPYNGDYYSARLTTKGKQEFTYGRIDIRAQMPVGRGIWPALWMLGGNISSVGWPTCGEIDIMEYLGHDPLTTYGTAHYNDGGHQSKGGHYTVNAAEAYDKQFHVFTIIWQENSIDWYVDYHRFYTVTSTTVNFDAFMLPQFFIFNVAVGGNWPGNPNASTVFPQSMIVDYVRIFQ
ncbi:MAG: family 16 glycosylhydrolase [Bacteroidales bacterium]|nr:family 16 glycosylhydrolase [Bacteroidales bacterium]